MSTTFRTKSEPGKPKKLPSGSTPDVQSIVSDEIVKVPYTDYEAEKGHPYSVDHFDLGRYWDEGVGSYESDVAVIESYIDNKIKSGEWANDQKTIKVELKKMEKMINMKDEARQSVKVGTLVAHIRFLQEAEGIKKNFGKYGNN